MTFVGLMRARVYRPWDGPLVQMVFSLPREAALGELGSRQRLQELLGTEFQSVPGPCTVRTFSAWWGPSLPCDAALPGSAGPQDG